MTNQVFYSMFLFMFLMFVILLMKLFPEQLRISALLQVPSSPVLDATHTDGLMRQSSEYASSFIPEFCADKLGRGINKTPALLMKR